MVDFSPIQRPPAGQILEAFREAAKHGDDVFVSVEGQDFKVLAQGQFTPTAGLGKSVAWVQEELDTTNIFMQALSQTYGTRISREVANSLNLAPSPGKPLTARSVSQALEMGQLGQQALGGVDFMTQLDHSASSGGRAFQRAMGELKIDPRALDSGSRQWIDEQMKLEFDAAQGSGQSPVSTETASAWLKKLLVNISLSEE
jgi:hypothetical protein